MNGKATISAIMQSMFWTSFLQMLSCEKSLAYFYRLRLPIERNEFEKTNQFARGCSELWLYNYIRKDIQTENLQASWKDYRKNSGILGEEILDEYQIENFTDQNIKQAFNNVAEILDYNKSEAIYDWAVRYFRDESDSVLESADRLYFLLNNLNKQENDNFQNIELDEDSAEKAKKFCNHVRWRNSSLDRHFAVAYEVHQMTLPNDWEMVLQDFGAEGYRSSYQWMRYVEYSLKYLNFCERWKQLRQDIGNEYIEQILKLLEINQNNFPRQFRRLKLEDLERLKNL